MKGITRIIVKVVQLFIIAIVLYLVFSVVAFDLKYWDWHWVIRFAYIIFVFFVSILTIA